MDEFGDDVREAQQQNAEEEEVLDEESDEESEESAEFLRDAIARLEAGEMILT
jgi:hypothetical protein